MLQSSKGTNSESVDASYGSCTLLVVKFIDICIKFHENSLEGFQVIVPSSTFFINDGA